ncbi:TadE/TadG family protein [Pseudomonas sp. R2.Fl]|nr:TadE/TadG family protein [Pseudomonas sp. R2.Fl]
MMINTFGRKNLAKALLADKRGNFGIMTAILLPVVLATAGVAIDLTRMVQVKSELQNAADAASLAAASAMAGKGISEAQAMQLARDFLAGQMANLITDNDSSSGVGVPADEVLERLKEDAKVMASETTAGTGKTFDVTVNARYELALNGLTSLLGYKSVTLEASSTSQSATESKNALSMFLVLDKSGSMAWITDTINTAKNKCKNFTEQNWNYQSSVKETSPCYVSKIEALKVATADLMAQLTKADPDQQYVRTAAVSYNGSAQKATSFTWGTATALTYVKALDAEGSTASTQAFKKAYETLIASAENDAHKAKNGQVPSKYIVFMTDGDNNSTSDDTQTKSWCDKAKTAGIEIFSVAFMAPSRGQALLNYCASSSSNYYDANDAEELVAAFQNIGEKAAQADTRLMN